MAKVNYTIGVQVGGGPQVNVPRTVDAEGHDKVDLEVAPQTEKTIDLQPALATKILILLIKSDLYAPEITFKIKGDGQESAELKLVEPQVFINDAVTLLKVDRPTSITIKNALPANPPKKAAIEIIVVRRA
jgi:hypothetical protein